MPNTWFLPITPELQHSITPVCCFQSACYLRLDAGKRKAVAGLTFRFDLDYDERDIISRFHALLKSPQSCKDGILYFRRPQIGILTDDAV